MFSLCQNLKWNPDWKSGLQKSQQTDAAENQTFQLYVFRFCVFCFVFEHSRIVCRKINISCKSIQKHLQEATNRNLVFTVTMKQYKSSSHAQLHTRDVPTTPLWANHYVSKRSQTLWNSRNSDSRQATPLAPVEANARIQQTVMQTTHKTQSKLFRENSPPTQMRSIRTLKIVPLWPKQNTFFLWSTRGKVSRREVGEASVMFLE